jgi:hypothetical protein
MRGLLESDEESHTFPFALPTKSGAADCSGIKILFCFCFCVQFSRELQCNRLQINHQKLCNLVALPFQRAVEAKAK